MLWLINLKNIGEMMMKLLILAICGLILNGCGGGGGSSGSSNTSNTNSKLQSLQLKATPLISKAGIAPNGTNILDLSTIGGHTDFTITITNPNVVAVGRPYVAIPFTWTALPTNGPSGAVPPIYFYHTQASDDCSLSNTMPANSTCKIYATMLWMPSVDDTQVYQIPLDIMYDDLITPHPAVPNWHNIRVSKCGYVPESKSIDDVCKDKSMMLYYKTSRGQLVDSTQWSSSRICYFGICNYPSLDGETWFTGIAKSGYSIEQQPVTYINESLILGGAISTTAAPDISSGTFIFDIKPTYDGSVLFWAIADDPYVDLTSSEHCFLGIGQCNNSFYNYKGDNTNSGRFTVGLDGSFWVGGDDFIKHTLAVAQIYDKVTDKFIPSNIMSERLYGINPDGVAIDMVESQVGDNHTATFTCYRKTSSDYTSYESQPLLNFNANPNKYFTMAPIQAYNSVYVAMPIPHLYTVDSQTTYEKEASPMGYYKINTENGKCEVEPDGEYFAFTQYTDGPSQRFPSMQINKKFIIIGSYYDDVQSATMSLDDLVPYAK